MSKIPIDVVDVSEDARLKRMHDTYQKQQAVLMTATTADLIAELVRRGLTPKGKRI